MFIVHNQALSDHDVEIKFGYLENEESEGCVLDSLDFISSKTEGQSYGDSLLGRVFASIGNTIDQGLRKDEPPPLAVFKAFITFKPPHDCTCDKNQVCVQQGSRKVCLTGEKCDSICQHGGTCVRQGRDKRCYCKDGFTGDDCSKPVLRFLKAPHDRSLEKHSSIYAECQLDVPKEIEVRYKWKLNGGVVGDYNTGTGFGVHPRGVLEIDSFVEEFEGQYACIAKSVLGTARHTFQYSMVSSCRIKIRPGPGIVKRNAGRSALLRCNAKPFNKVNTVLWKKMGVPIDYTNERFEMKSNFYLQINKIQLSDQGDYSCHVEANNGCRTSKRGKLIVLDYLPLNKYCGKSTLDEYYEESRLTQSTDAETNENPWHVIFRTKTSFSRTFCGGTLISRRFVLTAAHCITGFKIFSSKTVALFLGTTDCLGGGIKRTVRNYTIHPKYKKAAKFDNDIAIIELDTPVEYGDSIRPICLGEKGFVDESFLEKDLQTSLSPSSGRVVGCGRASESGNLHAVLQVLNLPYVPRKQCEESLKGETLPDSMFCAGSAIKDTGDACQGDSGGGLIMQTNDQWILVGIVSAGFGCDRAEHYGMYTNVGFVYDWVNGITRFDDDQDDTYLPETGCIAGQACEVKCQNGGTLVWQNNKSRCYCIDGFEGDDCSKYTDGDTNKALRFKKAPQGRNIQEGRSINPDCELDVPRDIEVQYQWTLDGVPIGAYNSETGFGALPGGLLVIDKFTEIHEGQYACIANTVLGTAEHTFNYRKVSKCEIEIYPGPGSVKKNVGQKVLLPCYVKPVRNVNRVSWKKNGVPIDYSDGRFEMKTNYYLQISDIKLSDQGSYSCHAEDRNGCSSSKKGTLTVLDYQPLNKYCGITTWDEEIIQSRLSQAATARVNEHPWHANFRTKDTPSKSFCGGTLISRKFVLTAAHCIDEFKKLDIGPFSSKTLSIFFGTTDCLGGGIKRTVGNYTIHPNYNKATTYDNDIAIIELDTPVEYGDSIRPICLGEEGFVNEMFLEKNYQTSLRSSTGRVAGCGKRSQHGSLHKSLRVVHLPYVPLDQCDNSFSEVGKTLTDSMFCAGSKVARTGDACQGDTGGGLVMPTDEHWVLTGIVSYGVGCDVANIYGVYTHVGLFYDWIKEKTKFDEEQVEKFLQERN